MSRFYFFQSELRQALSDNAIYPCYQPIINAVTGELYGLEVLTRWRGKSGYIYSPSNFIPEFERAGLALEFSRYLMAVVGRDITRLDAMLPEGLHLALNFNAASIQASGFVAEYLAFQAAIPAKKYAFVIEVTETQSLNRISRTVLQLLKFANAKIFLDDFGTSFSNLDYLLMLDVDGIKLDRRFIQEYQVERADVIIQHTLTLASALNLDIIVEGIEEQAQCEYLCANGGQLQQGFLHSAPLNYDELEIYLNKMGLNK
ncbi:EAL domain-containing protein [Enterobacteriaceae bacterium strain FGI 57]|jgi:FOG: EAL domain|nr:EAL domain-containing protein [Enterobacteriaceae bacterium strain FGI 57]